jgi:hypothetical protein
MRRRPQRRAARRAVTATLLILALPLLPLPWRAAPASAGPGTAWRVDGRLEVDGVPLDPPGEVLWLAAGRPQLLGERVREAATGRGRATPLTRGDPATTPRESVPAAITAAMRAAGRDVPDAIDARLKLAIGPMDLGRLGAGLHLGDSHGLALAVAVLRNEGVLDLGDATVAATGRVAPDGRVLPVGGIGPKTRAAVRAGATTVMVPQGQEAEARDVVGIDGVTVIGVDLLQGLITP